MKLSKRLIKKYWKDLIIWLTVSILSTIILFIFKDLLLYRALYIFYFLFRIIYLAWLLLINTCLYFLNKKYWIVKKSIAIITLSLLVIVLWSIMLFFNKKNSNKEYLNILYLSSTNQTNIENEFMDDVNMHFGNEYFIPLMHLDITKTPKYIEINNFIEEYTETKEGNYDLIVYIKCDNQSDKESCYFYNHMPQVWYIWIADDFMKKLKNNNIKSKTDFEINIIYNLIVRKLVNLKKFNPETHYFILKDRYKFQKEFLSSIKDLFINSWNYNNEINNIETSMNNLLYNYFYEKDPKEALEYLLKNFDISPIIKTPSLIDYVNIYELAWIENIIKNWTNSLNIFDDKDYINWAIVGSFDYDFIYQEPAYQLEKFLIKYPELIDQVYSKYKDNPFIIFSLWMAYSELAGIGAFNEPNYTEQQISYQKKSIELLKQFSKIYKWYFYLPFKIENLELELELALWADIYETINKLMDLYKKYEPIDEDIEEIKLLEQEYSYLLENSINPRVNWMLNISHKCEQDNTIKDEIRKCVLWTDIYKIIDKLNKIIKNNYPQDKEIQNVIKFIKQYKKRYHL